MSAVEKGRLEASELINQADGSNKLPAVPLATTTNLDGTPIEHIRPDNNIATDVLVHISGHYKPFNYVNVKLGASAGCFGFVPDNTVKKTKKELNDLLDYKGDSVEPDKNLLRDEEVYISNEPYKILTDKIEELQQKYEDNFPKILVVKRNNVIKITTASEYE
jgi:hypothetical protein